LTEQQARALSQQIYGTENARAREKVIAMMATSFSGILQLFYGRVAIIRFPSYT
jgi:hypothetical protein